MRSSIAILSITLNVEPGTCEPVNLYASFLYFYHSCIPFAKKIYIM
jgi:hypothetical protein